VDGAFSSVSIAAVGVVKDEGDIIGSTLLHLYRLGFRRLVIADNDSTDATPEIIRQFAARHPEVTLVLLHEREAHVQWRKVTAMAHFAHHYFGVDYLYPFDADEFLVPAPAPAGPGTPDADASSTGPIPRGSGRASDWEYIHLPWITCISRGDGEPLAMCGEGRRLGKLLVRWHERLVIRQGNHAIEPHRRRWWERAARAPRGVQTGWRVLHVPVRSVGQLRAKILRSAAENRDNPGKWGTQSRSLHEAFLRHGDAVFEALFERVTDPGSDRQDLHRFAQRFGIDPRALSYFQDFFGPRAPAGFRVPLAAGTAPAAASEPA
jgi:glycosyltransferase involved in cell wall biosynthesis